MNKKVKSDRRPLYLKIYNYFQQVTIDFVHMLMTAAIDSTEAPLLYASIKQIRSIDTRETVDELFRMVSSSPSLLKRQYSAELLVHLAQMGQVTVIEVHEILIKSIEASHERLQSASKDHQSLNCYLIRLLCCLISGKTDISPDNYLPTSDSAPLIHLICWKIPTVT